MVFLVTSFLVAAVSTWQFLARLPMPNSLVIPSIKMALSIIRRLSPCSCRWGFSMNGDRHSPGI